MPKAKGTGAIQRAQEQRWKLIVRNSSFRKGLSILYKELWKTGKVREERVEKLAQRWGVPCIPWEAITHFDTFINEADRISFLEWCGLRWGPGAFGVSYNPLATHRVEQNRFAFLMADLDHPVDDLVELFKSELQRIKGGPPPSRKRLDKTDDYIKCWDLVRRKMTLSEIAKAVYPEKWSELPPGIAESLFVEPTPKETENRARELRAKGQCAYNWSFRQAREDLIEEKIKQKKIQDKLVKRAVRDALRLRATLRQRVWRNIQRAHDSIKRIAPKFPPKA